VVGVSKPHHAEGSQTDNCCAPAVVRKSRAPRGSLSGPRGEWALEPQFELLCGRRDLRVCQVMLCPIDNGRSLPKRN
jgi:hypothetical protein